MDKPKISAIQNMSMFAKTLPHLADGLPMASWTVLKSHWTVTGDQHKAEREAYQAMPSKFGKEGK